MEDQIDALGLMLNTLVLLTTRSMDPVQQPYGWIRRPATQSFSW
ncbi:hypothetical protein [Streptomyces triculaminicus]|nr:hypothetical protein [Streptomyces triculaminicus]